MKLTHRIVELQNGMFIIERYVPWNFFGIEIPMWEVYLESIESSEYRPIQFTTQLYALGWMQERFGNDNLKIKNLSVVLGMKCNG